MIGVAPPEFFGADPGAHPDIYLRLHASCFCIAMVPIPLASGLRTRN